MRDEGCACGTADLRKGKTAVQQELGEKNEMIKREAALQASSSVQEEGRRFFRHGAEFPCSPGKAHGEAGCPPCKRVGGTTAHGDLLEQRTGGLHFSLYPI